IEGGLAVASYIAWCSAFRPSSRMPVLAAGAVALAALSPFIYFTLRTAAVGENSAATIIGSMLQDLPRRGTVMGAPFAIAAAAPWIRAHYRQVGTAFAAVAAGGIAGRSGYVGRTQRARAGG